MPKSLDSLTIEELSALADKLSKQIDDTARAYTRDPQYLKLARQLEARRFQVSANNSPRNYRLNYRYQKILALISKKDREHELAKEQRRVAKKVDLPYHVKLWYRAGNFERFKEDVIWCQDDEFALLRTPPGATWVGRFMDRKYVPVVYRLFDLRDYKNPREIWKWEGRLTRDAMINVQSIVNQLITTTK